MKKKAKTRRQKKYQEIAKKSEILA